MRWIETQKLVSEKHPLAEEAVEFASEILYNLTGRRYTGRYTTTECFTGFSTSQGTMAHRPALIGGKMYNLPVSLGSGTDTKVYSRGTIYRLLSVTINGADAPIDDFYISDNIAFARKDGRVVVSGNDDVCFTYETGLAVPKALQRACQRYADELILWDMDDETCAIPRNTSTVSRQGESFTLMMPDDFISDGRTGIYEVDQAIKAFSRKHHAGIATLKRKTGEARR